MSEELYQQKDIENSTNLLISILICYPEIGTLRFLSKEKRLKFTFLLGEALPEEDFNIFKTRLKNSLELFHELEEREFLRLHISNSQFENLTLISIERDLSSFSSRELSLLVDILKDVFKDRLLHDQGNEMDPLHQKVASRQKERISSIIKKIRESNNNENAVGIREDGRVLIYNSSR